MDSFDAFLSTNIRRNNKKAMRSFLVILLILDTVNYLFNLKNPQIFGCEENGLYYTVMPVILAVSLLVLILNEKGPKVLTPYLGYIFIPYTAISRLISFDGCQFGWLSLLAYVVLYLIIASLFLYNRELFISVMFTQVILLIILIKLQFSFYLSLSTMLASTLLRF